MIRLPPIARTVLYGLVLVGSCQSASVSAQGVALAVVTETVISEPVFRGEVHLFTAGPAAAPTVVLVHGLGDMGARDWNGLIAELVPRFRIVTFDLPGFGRSTRGNKLYSPEKYAEFVHYLMKEHIHAQTFALVGHSMGGAIALRYAARFPREVTALVLADVPGILHPMAYSKFLSHLGIDFIPSLYPAQHDHLRNLVGSVLSLTGKAKPLPEMIVASATLRQSLLKAEPTKIAGLALALENFSADLPRVQAPVLVLWGGRDTIAPLRSGQVLSANLPNALLEVFKNSGHTPMEDVGPQFYARVAAFLSQPVIEKRNDILQQSLLPPASDRVGRCSGQRGQVFEGDYDRITIYRCRATSLQHVRVRELLISNAVVNVENSLIGGKAGGMEVNEARVTVTSSLITGPVAITATAAHLDIAGSRIIGETAALVAPRKSEVVFSMSQVQSPNFYGTMHELRVIEPGKPL